MLSMLSMGGGGVNVKTFIYQLMWYLEPATRLRWSLAGLAGLSTTKQV